MESKTKMKYSYEIKKIKDNLGSDVFNYLSKLDCFLAGGAITSIYNKKEINDLDIYCASEKIAYNIAFYLTEEDDYKCMSRTKKSSVFSTNEKVLTVIKGEEI
jgi:hypothetical protein